MIIVDPSVFNLNHLGTNTMSMMLIYHIVIQSIMQHQLMLTNHILIVLTVTLELKLSYLDKTDGVLAVVATIKKQKRDLNGRKIVNTKDA